MVNISHMKTNARGWLPIEGQVKKQTGFFAVPSVPTVQDSLMFGRQVFDLIALEVNQATIRLEIYKYNLF